MLPLRLLPLLGLAACGYRPCGTIQYWTSAVDPRFDEDGDQYIDLNEACGVDYGSFGARFPDVGVLQVLFDASQWDLGDAADISYDYLPITELYFREAHVEVGAVLGMEAIGGYGFHKPAGSFDSPTETWSLHDARLEVLAGPRETTFGGQAWKIDFDVTIGEPTADAPQGRQRLIGADWIPFDDALWTWDPVEHNGSPPDL